MQPFAIHLWGALCASTGGGGGGFAPGIFRRGIFRVSNSCEISHIIFRALREINPLQNLALGLALGYQQYARPLARAGFASMAELALITSKSLKACKVLDGHALRIVDELKKRRALGVLPPKKPSKRPADISSFMDLCKKRQKKEAHT